ncbi:MAG: hypothetical protein LQ344_008081 [Seirophora lacunosa]|nr:MAG: hypothetical protein LQ344_008081 [Seirophora lacunosa]
MSFRLNFDLSLSFPSPPPRSDDDMRNQPQPTTTPAQGQDDDGRRRPQGWWRTARQHPHFVLRVIYLVATLMGLILDTVLLSNIGYYYYAVVSLHQTALVPLTIGFLWQTLILFHTRLFPRRRTNSIPNWLIALVETLGYLTFLALLVGNGLAIREDGGGDTFTLWQIMLITYDSAVWVALW